MFIQNQTAYLIGIRFLFQHSTCCTLFFLLIIQVWKIYHILNFLIFCLSCFEFYILMMMTSVAWLIFKSTLSRVFNFVFCPKTKKKILHKIAFNLLNFEIWISVWMLAFKFTCHSWNRKKIYYNISNSHMVVIIISIKSFQWFLFHSLVFVSFFP